MSLQDLAGGIAAGLAVAILVSPSIVDWSHDAPPVAAARSVEPMKRDAASDSGSVSDQAAGWLALSEWTQTLSEFLERDEAEQHARCPDAPARAGLFAAVGTGDYCPISDH